MFKEVKRFSQIYFHVDLVETWLVSCHHSKFSQMKKTETVLRGREAFRVRPYTDAQNTFQEDTTRPAER